MSPLTRQLVRGALLTLVAAACVPAAPGTPNAPAPARRQADVITADEIARSGASDAYHAIQHLRPGFLYTRGQQSLSGAEPPVAYVNGQRWGSLESLKNLPAHDVLMVQRLSATQASSRYGLNNLGGALDVTTKHGKQ